MGGELVGVLLAVAGWGRCWHMLLVIFTICITLPSV